MRLFHDRPLAALTAVFAAVSVAAFYMTGKAKVFLAALILAAAVLFLAAETFLPCRRTAAKHRAFAAALAVFALAALAESYIFVDVLYANDKMLDGTSAHVSGYVTDTVTETSYYSRFRVVITNIDGGDAHIGAILEADFSTEFSVGDGFRADVVFSALNDDGGFDEEAYYLPRGVAIKAEVADADSISFAGTQKSADVFFAGLRSRLAAKLGVALDGFGGNGIAEALIVGDREAADDTVIRDFTYIGALHLLAISGLHLSIIIGGADTILTRLMPKTLRSVMLMFLTFAYMSLTGFPPSVTRAGVMLMIYYASHFARREPDPVTSLFFAAAVVMAVSPMSAGDVGLILSVLATLGCIFGNKLFYTEKMRASFAKLARRGVLCKCISRLAKYVYSTLAISVSALLFTLPVMWLSFGRVSLLSPLSTLVMAPVISPIIYLGIAVVILSGFGALAAPFAFVCGALCRAAAWEASVLSRIYGAVLPLSDELPFAAAGVVVATMCLIPALICGKKGARRSLAASCAVFVFIGAAGVIYMNSISTDAAEYYVKGKNDIITVSDGNRTLICDVTDGSWTPVSLALSEKFHERVDVYMLTHLHRRHAETFERLCAREYVREVWVPMPETHEETVVYRTLLELAEYNGITLVPYERGDTLAFGSVTVGTIPYSMLDRSTHPVISVSFDTDAGKTVYVGSSVHESGAYDRAVDMCADADCLIFGAHGPVCKSGAPYFPSPGTRIIYANVDVADFMIDHNNTGKFEIFGE